MNCLYKCHSIDEEDDRDSSLESELEGEKKAEELASLEALDDEGEWC